MSDDKSRSPESPADEAGDSQPDIVARLRTALLSALGIRQNGSARAEIEDAIAADEATGETLTADERTMLRAILRLGDMTVDDVMIPRADIEALDIEITVADVIGIFRRSGHSRMPVYRETLDDPVGMVHIRDLMAWIADRALKPVGEPETMKPRFDFAAVDLTGTLEDSKLVRPLLFVPPTMPARVLLKRMQTTRTQMALVIDEYGGTDGLVSMEDLVELIVGEIEDEHDLDEEPTVTQVADGVFIADARAEVSEAAKVIGPNFNVGDKSEEFDTIAGLVFAATGRIPPKGEVVEAVEGYDFEVLDADPRRIKKVRIRDRARAAPPVRQKRAAAG